MVLIDNSFSFGLSHRAAAQNMSRGGNAAQRFGNQSNRFSIDYFGILFSQLLRLRIAGGWVFALFDRSSHSEKSAPETQRGIDGLHKQQYLCTSGKIPDK